MANAIGAAGDFYRIRVMHVDDTDEVDFEWRDDILYRRPPDDVPAEGELYRVEAVLLDDEEVVRAIAIFDDSAAAHELADECTEALADMTKSGFEARYLSPDE